MSRSIRKRPFMAITGVSSAKRDKRIAARAFRRLVKAITSNSEDPVIPHRREAAHNNVYGWVREGRQRYQSAYVRRGQEKGTLEPDRDWYKALFRK